MLSYRMSLMFIALIVPHGIFEIPALIFESVAGVLLFLFIWRFLKTIDTTRNDVPGFKLRAKNSWKLNRIYLKQSIVLMVFSCFLLIVAALSIFNSFPTKIPNRMVQVTIMRR